MQLIRVEKLTVTPAGVVDWAETAQAYAPYAAILIKAAGTYRVQVDSNLADGQGQPVLLQRIFELEVNEHAIVDGGGVMVLRTADSPLTEG